MAVSRSKTWIAGEVLTASDLNSEFNNILNNGEDLGWPATKAKDFDGQQLILDADADSDFTADTDDRLDLALAGTDLFRWDGTVATPVNGLDFIAAVAGTSSRIDAVGSDSNIQFDLRGKGTSGVGLFTGTTERARFDGTTPIIAKNGIINGDFRVAQRGTSFTSATTPANNDDTYLLDRWVLLSDGNDAVDVTQETTTVPTGSYAAIRLDVETGNVKFGLLQVLEARAAAALIGGTASLSFQARRTGTSIDHLRAAIIAWDSTADSVTSDVVSAWNAAGTDPTLVTNWTYENTPANLATLTTSYQTFTISNISIDTASATNVAVFIWIDDVTTTVGDFLYIADVQLELGAVATPFERRPIGQELVLCQRYYTKTFPQGTAPAQNAGTDGAIAYRVRVAGVSNQTEAWHLPQTMRASPSVTFYNPSAANALWRNADDAADSGAATAETFGNDRSVIIRNAQVAGDAASETVSIHVTASAEL